MGGRSPILPLCGYRQCGRSAPHTWREKHFCCEHFTDTVTQWVLHIEKVMTDRERRRADIVRELLTQIKELKEDG